MATIEPPPPKAQKLLAVIAREIKARPVVKGDANTFIAFSELLALFGETAPGYLIGKRLNELGLKELHEWLEERPKLPKVTGLIVYKHGRKPHRDFSEWHGHKNEPNWEQWWMDEANRAIDFDWSPWVPQIDHEGLKKYLEGVRIREEPAPPQRRYRDIITLEPGKRGGRPCIRGLRITVGDILGWLAAGMDTAEIIDDFPELTTEDISAALAFAADREKHVVSVAAESR